MSTLKAVNLQHPSSTNVNISMTSSGGVGVGTTTPTSSRALTLNSPSNYFGIDFQYNGTTQVKMIQEATGSLYVDYNENNASGALNFRKYGGNNVLKLDSNGYVTKPYQPAFRAHNGSAASGATINFASNDTAFNGRNAGWNGSTRYTVPIAGVYLFTFAALINGGNYGRILFKINGSASTTYGDTLIGSIASYISVSMAMAFCLNASDYVELYNEQAALYSGNYSSFSGYLVG